MICDPKSHVKGGGERGGKAFSSQKLIISRFGCVSQRRLQPVRADPATQFPEPWEEKSLLISRTV